VALKVEGIVNRTVHAEKALGGSSRLEPLQLALASSDCLMRILRPIVLPRPLLMPTGQSQTLERRGVGAQLVGDQQFRRETLLLEQPRHKVVRGHEQSDEGKIDGYGAKKRPGRGPPPDAPKANFRTGLLQTNKPSTAPRIAHPD